MTKSGLFTQTLSTFYQPSSREQPLEKPPCFPHALSSATELLPTLGLSQLVAGPKPEQSSAVGFKEPFATSGEPVGAAGNP